MRKKPNVGARLVLTGFMAIVVFIGANMLRTSFGELMESRESMNWPTVSGRVTQSKMKAVSTSVRRKGSDGIRRSHSETHYEADIEYEFNIDGATHKGNRITTVRGGNLADESNVQKVVDKYPVGKEVKVSYQPGDPSQCVLEPGSSGGFIVMAGLPLFLIVVGISVTVFGWSPNANKYISGL